MNAMPSIALPCPNGSDATANTIVILLLTAIALSLAYIATLVEKMVVLMKKTENNTYSTEIHAYHTAKQIADITPVLNGQKFPEPPHEMCHEDFFTTLNQRNYIED